MQTRDWDIGLGILGLPLSGWPNPEDLKSLNLTYLVITSTFNQTLIRYVNPIRVSEDKEPFFTACAQVLQCRQHA